MYPPSSWLYPPPLRLPLLWYNVMYLPRYLVPPAAILTSIPVFSIIVKDNLVSIGLCGPRWAGFWAVFFPWVLALVLYEGDSLGVILNWTGILLTAPINMMLPCWFYLKVSGRCVYVCE